MSLIEKLDGVLALADDAMNAKDGLDCVALSINFDVMAGVFLRTNGPAIRQAMIDAERIKRDIEELYDVMPMLPITAETMDAATDWFTRYCIDFYREINAVQVRRQEEGHD